MSKISTGRVASLHLHPGNSGEPMQAVEAMELVAQKGIAGNGRYFGRINRNGQPGKRQVTLIEREQIAEHAAIVALPHLSPGLVRANIETSNIDLISLLGRQVQVGEATLLFYEARTPCDKMDRICQGLRALMENQKQGVLAQVIQGGVIRIGDPIKAI